MRYSVGVDIAKRRHEGIIVNDQGSIVGQSVTIENSRDAFASFEARLQKLPDSCQEDVEIGIEATGPYWIVFYEYFTTRGWKVHVFNPLQINAYRKIEIRKVKNDSRDAFKIAEFLRKKEGPARQVPEEQTLRIRELSRMRFRLIDQIGDIKRSVLNVLDRVFPEYETLFSDVFLLTSQALLKEAVTAEEFAAFDLAELTKLLSKQSRGRFGQTKAQEIVAAAQNSVGIPWLAEAAHLEVSLLLSQVQFLEQQVLQLEDALEKMMAEAPPQHLTSFAGIGSTLAAAIIGEIGTIDRFYSSGSLVAYSGVDAAVYKSGEFDATKMHMSKRGSPYLRRAIWLAASNARRYDPDFQEYYIKKKAEGKHHNTIIGALCRKLLERIYIVLKEQRPYIGRSVTVDDGQAV